MNSPVMIHVDKRETLNFGGINFEFEGTKRQKNVLIFEA